MGFEKFEKGSYQGSSQPRVTLRQSDSIGLSSVIVEEYFDDVDGAVLYYDEDENKVGIEPADTEENTDAYAVTSTSGSGSIQASSMMRRYELTPEETTAYEPEWDDELGMLVIDLDEPV
jgi:hypothetical protein